MSFSKEKRSDFHLNVFLYDDPSSKTLDLKEISNYLKQKLGNITVKVRKDFITFNLNPNNTDELSKSLALCRVRNLSNPDVDIDPLLGEVRFEKILINYPKKKFLGVLYDGYRLDGVFQSLIPQEELDINNLHVIFTNRLFGTFDKNDQRYHARAIICGYPSIISTSGIVEAPAKPREFYHLKQKYLSLGINVPPEVIKKEFHGRFIEYDDPRLTEIMKGYVMQMIFYHLTYEPFCEDKNCRLYNAHWQEEVINAQLEGAEFCKRHEHILKNMRGES